MKAGGVDWVVLGWSPMFISPPQAAEREQQAHMGTKQSLRCQLGAPWGSIPTAHWHTSKMSSAAQLKKVTRP